MRSCTVLPCDRLSWSYGTFYAFSVLFSSCLAAADKKWEIQTYGGNYYGADRAAVYGAFTTALPFDSTVTIEAIGEKADNYKFGGIGGHLLWWISEDWRLGFVGSIGKEKYPVELYIDNRRVDHYDQERDLSTLAFEAEASLDAFTLSAQIGKILSPDQTIDDNPYSSIEVYYWDLSDNWYLRGVDQRTTANALTFVEGYRPWSAMNVTGTLYLGASTGVDEYCYAGSYLELLNRNNSQIFLDIGGGYSEKEWSLQLEIHVTFGPGAEAPSISSFGYIVGD